MHKALSASSTLTSVLGDLIYWSQARTYLRNYNWQLAVNLSSPNLNTWSCETPRHMNSNRAEEKVHQEQPSDGLGMYQNRGTRKIQIACNWGFGFVVWLLGWRAPNKSEKYSPRAGNWKQLRTEK